jgi:hypothetical protein
MIRNTKETFNDYYAHLEKEAKSDLQ